MRGLLDDIRLLRGLYSNLRSLIFSLVIYTNYMVSSVKNIASFSVISMTVTPQYISLAMVDIPSDALSAD